ncbi:MAG: phosphatase PAP2 family protein [Nanoarchaeota archaeon]|nr:phosphatase PAP2 family protein [Nanoarchaeota archaeon]
MKKEFYFSILIISAIFAFIFDKKIMGFFVSIRNPFFDYIFLGFSLAGNIFIIFFFLTAVFLWKENKRRWIIPLWLSGIFAIIISFILKIIIQRSRPFENGFPALEILFYLMKNSFNSWDFSFPSMHAMFVFASVPILIKEFKKLKFIWIIFACAAAFSRSYFGVHYLSDIMFGAIIGYLIGMTLIYLEEKYEIGKKVIRKLKLE